jgi:NAD(P)-dependent dehydrogenase (short-subunit alcohol dehydrogenase family)
MTTAKRVALITGGAKGIGRAVARHLAASGWRLGIIDLPESGPQRAQPRARNILSIEGDVRDEASVADAVETLLRRFGRLDGVVSNAGIMKRISGRDGAPTLSVKSDA